MGQKVHPQGFRLGVSEEHRSVWFVKPKKKAKYAACILQEACIRQMVFREFKHAGVTDVFVTRHGSILQLVVCVSRMKLVSHSQIATKVVHTIQRTNENALVDWNSSHKTNTPQVSVVMKPNQFHDAATIATSICTQLQNRVPFRKVLKQSLNVSHVEGIKIQISGRLNGSEIARTEWAKHGQIPLHTLRASIDYTYQPANTNYGVLGVKVWVYKQ
jgi:small subunit ribosomal protein S3